MLRDETMERDALQGKTLVFVVGVFRSGTSLLHRLLQAHPAMSLLWEADALRFLSAKTGPDWWRRLDEWNGCITRHDIDGISLPLRALREDAALALYLARTKSDPSIRIVGEKSPYYCDVLPRLARDFPLARFIVIHRAPAQTLASVRKAAGENRFFNRPWMPLRVLKDAGRLQRDAGRLRRRGHAVYEIDFDQLVNEPIATMDNLFRRLGLDPEHAAGQSGAELGKWIPPGKHHQKVLQDPVDAARSGTHTADASTMRHLALRAWLHDRSLDGWKLIPHVLTLLAEETAYRAVLAMECAKRMAFRNLPLSWLRRHRATSRHAVK
jgi:hypothetical protein